VIGIVIGMTQADIGGRATATLSYSEIRHAGPVFHGDTLYAESVIVDAGELPGGDGVVTVETRATNQRGELVLAPRRKIVAPMKRGMGETECKR